MNRRNDKRKTAIWILQQLMIGAVNETKTGSYKDLTENLPFKTISMRKDYKSYSVKYLQEKGSYSYDKLFDAIYLLGSKGHIEFRANKDLYTNSTLNCTTEGEIALTDDFYEDDIDQYNNDKKYLKIKWIIPLVAFAFTVIATIWTTYQNATYKKDIQILKERLDKLEQVPASYNKLIPSQKSESPTKINDSTGASNGQ